VLSPATPISRLACFGNLAAGLPPISGSGRGTGAAGAHSLLPPLAPASLDIRRADGRHIVLRDSHGSHHLWLPDPQAGMPLAVLVPLDDVTPLRVAGLMRLRRHLVGRASGPPPQAWRITPRQRRRLVLMVRALDGHLAKASYREIAEALHGPDASPI
jgi:hypothetical protein